MTNTTARQVLNLPLPPNDAEAATIRDYLIALLALVWTDRECFNGKRPFGNSGWQYELYPALITAGLVAGQLDEDGYVKEVDRQAADALIGAAIRELAR